MVIQKLEHRVMLVFLSSADRLAHAQPRMCEQSDCDPYADSQQSGAFPACLYKYYACGDYEPVVSWVYSILQQDRPGDASSTQAPVIDPVYRYLLGAAHHALHVRNFGVKALRCEYRRLATTNLRQFLEDSRTHRDKTGSYGNYADTPALIAHTTQMLQDLAELKGCLELPLSTSDIQLFARQYARERIENAFLSADTSSDDTAKGIQAAFRSIKDTLQATVATASHLESGLAMAEVQQRATQQRLDKVTTALQTLVREVNQYADAGNDTGGQSPTELCQWIGKV